MMHKNHNAVMGLILGVTDYHPLVREIITGHMTHDVVCTQNAILDLLYISGAC